MLQLQAPLTHSEGYFIAQHLSLHNFHVTNQESGIRSPERVRLALQFLTRFLRRAWTITNLKIQSERFIVVPPQCSFIIKSMTCELQG